MLESSSIDVVIVVKVLFEYIEGLLIKQKISIKTHINRSSSKKNTSLSKRFFFNITSSFTLVKVSFLFTFIIF